jgi:hypothetical protein
LLLFDVVIRKSGYWWSYGILELVWWPTYDRDCLSRVVRLLLLLLITWKKKFN